MIHGYIHTHFVPDSWLWLRSNVFNAFSLPSSGGIDAGTTTKDGFFTDNKAFPGLTDERPTPKMCYRMINRAGVSAVPGAYTGGAWNILPSNTRQSLESTTVCGVPSFIRTHLALTMIDLKLPPRC